MVRGLGQGRGPRGWGAPWREQGELSEGQVVGARLHQALFSAGATPRVPGHLARLAGGPGLHLPGSGFPLPPPTWAACLGHSPEHFCSCSALAISTPNGEWENHPFPDAWVGRRASLRPPHQRARCPEVPGGSFRILGLEPGALNHLARELGPSQAARVPGRALGLP